jgi:DNA-binding Lrp family transcriptional regulator
VNIHSIAESFGIPRETVRRKVAKLVRAGWIARQGSTLHFASKGYRETSFVREARQRLAIEYYEISARNPASSRSAHVTGLTSTGDGAGRLIK